MLKPLDDSDDDLHRLRLFKSAFKTLRQAWRNSSPPSLFGTVAVEAVCIKLEGGDYSESRELVT